MISHRQTKNATIPQLPDIGRNRVAGHFEIEEGAIRKSGVAEYFKKGEGMESVNGDISEVSFLD